MSPQNKVTIKELDGLPVGEIDLRITQSEQRTVRAMENKLDEHRELIEHRLDEQDCKLETLQVNVTALVGTEQVPGMIHRNTELLENLSLKHEAWHCEDLAYRSGMVERVTAIEAETKKLGTQVRAIRILVVVFNTLAKCLTKCLEGLKTEAFWKVFGVAFVIWLISHFAPGAEHILKEIFLH